VADSKQRQARGVRCIVRLLIKTRNSITSCLIVHLLLCLFCVGVALEGSNKKYSQTTQRPVRVTMAALDPSQSHGTLFSVTGF